MNEQSTGHLTACQLCASEKLQTVLTLGHHPLVHGHLTASDLHKPEVTYPLNMCRCLECGLVQLDYIVDQKIVFAPSYPYQTGLTNMLIRACRSLTDALCDQFGLGADHLAVDIGSNDGTLLEGFRARGMRVLGVEPTDIAQIAVSRGVPTVQDFFSTATAERIRAEHGPAQVITATNVFAHVSDLYGFLEGIKVLLADDGVFVSDSQYLLDIFEKLEFDTIYHEHLRFYSVRVLQTLFAHVGMTLVDAERISSAGGSIRAFARLGQYPSSERVQQLIDAETQAGLLNAETYETFATQSIAAIRALVRAVEESADKGIVAALGAPARSNTLLNFARFSTRTIAYAGEKNGSPKIGLLTPGAHIPVVDESRLIEEQPPYALILSWHIGEELIALLRKKGYKGTCILPLPTVRFIRD